MFSDGTCTFFHFLFTYWQTLLLEKLKLAKRANKVKVVIILRGKNLQLFIFAAESWLYFRPAGECAFADYLPFTPFFILPLTSVG